MDIMEHYSKGEEKEVDDPYPFSVDDALQMRVTPGSKIRNVMGFAMKKMADTDSEREIKQITWNGSGSSVTKTITCAEIMKRKLKGLHQITKIRFKRVEEHWIPKVEGLEPLKVNRDIPAISILLSKDPLDTAESGYQPPGNFETFWQEKRNADKMGRNRPRSSRKSGGQPDPEQSARRPRKQKKWQSAGASANAGSKEVAKEEARAAKAKNENTSSPMDTSSKDMS